MAPSRLLLIAAAALVLTLATCDEGTTSVQGGYDAVREEGIALLKNLEQKSKDEAQRNEIERQNASLFSRFVSLRKRNCWQSALDGMKEQCRSRSEESLARLAFRFTNCHLEHSGLRVYSCAPKASTSECTKRLAKDASAFAAFTQFRVHVWTICFSLEQKEMEDYMFWVTRTLLDGSQKSLLQQERLQAGLDVLGALQARLHNDTVAAVSLVTEEVGGLAEGVQKTLENSVRSLENERTLLEVQQHVKSRIMGLDQAVETSATRLVDQIERIHDHQHLVYTKIKVISDLVCSLKDHWGRLCLAAAAVVIMVVGGGRLRLILPVLALTATGGAHSLEKMIACLIIFAGASFFLSFFTSRRESKTCERLREEIFDLERRVKSLGEEVSQIAAVVSRARGALESDAKPSATTSIPRKKKRSARIARKRNLKM